MHFPIVVKITVIKFMGAISHNLRDEKLIENSNININEYIIKKNKTITLLVPRQNAFKVDVKCKINVAEKRHSFGNIFFQKMSLC